MVETDDTDEAIIRLLQVDGRMSNREVARQLEMSEGTVRQRLKRLQEAGALRLGAVVDPTKMGYAASAYLHLKVTPKKLRAIAARIAKLEAASFVGIVLGEFNLVAVLTAKDREELADLLNREIHQTAGVLFVRVDEIVHTYKHRFDIVRIK